MSDVFVFLKENVFIDFLGNNNKIILIIKFVLKIILKELTVKYQLSYTRPQTCSFSEMGLGSPATDSAPDLPNGLGSGLAPWASVSPSVSQGDGPDSLQNPSSTDIR